MGGMDEDLSNLWGKFPRSQEESIGVEMQEETLGDNANKEKSCLVGKLNAYHVI